MKLLFIDCCISQRGKEGRTRKLCRAFLEAAKKADPALKVEHLDLTETVLQPYTVAMLDKRDALFKAGSFDDSLYALAGQFRDADGILVGAPFWDLSFPAQLRIYMEHISANGVTYYYDADGPHGSCRAEWLVYLTSAGDFEHAGSIGTEYWKQLSGMFGIDHYHSIFSGGLDAVPGRAEEILAESCKEAERLAEALVRM